MKIWEKLFDIGGKSAIESLFVINKDKRFYESYQNRHLRDDICAEHPVFREIFLLKAVARKGYLFQAGFEKRALLSAKFC